MCVFQSREIIRVLLVWKKNVLNVCKDVCTNAIGVHGTYTFEQTCGEAVCINCGQCANVCPVDSIMEKYEYLDVKREVQNSEKIVIVSTSPSV